MHKRQEEAFNLNPSQAKTKFSQATRWKWEEEGEEGGKEEVWGGASEVLSHSGKSEKGCEVWTPLTHFKMTKAAPKTKMIDMRTMKRPNETLTSSEEWGVMVNKYGQQHQHKYKMKTRMIDGHCMWWQSYFYHICTYNWCCIMMFSPLTIFVNSVLVNIYICGHLSFADLRLSWVNFCHQN